MKTCCCTFPISVMAVSMFWIKIALGLKLGIIFQTGNVLRTPEEDIK